MPSKEEAQHAEGLVQAEQLRAWERADSYWGSSPGRHGEPLPGRGRGGETILAVGEERDAM